MLKQLKQLGLALLLTWLLCLSVFAQQAEDLTKRQKQEPPPKPILDAPSLSIPAMPAYKTTVKDLGYESVDDLLKQSVQAQSKLNSIAFDKSGLLAAGSDDGVVKLWRVGSGEIVYTLQAQGSVNSVAFDGSGLLAAGSNDGTVKLWRVSNGELVNILQAQSPVYSVAFDGSGLLAAGSESGTVKLWKVSNGKLLNILQAPQRVRSVAFSSGLLAAGSERSGIVNLWQVKTGKLVNTFQAQGEVRSVAFDSSGLLAAGSESGTVEFWRVSSGDLVKTLQAQKRVMSVTFDHSGLLASGSDDGTLQLWRVESGELVQTLRALGDVSSVAFSGSGLLAVGSQEAVHLWWVDSGKLVNTLQTASNVHSVAFGGSSLLATVSYDRLVKLWQVKTSELVTTLQAQSEVQSMAFDSSGLLATASYNGLIQLWQVKTGKLVNTLQAQSEVQSMAFDVSGLLATVSNDNLMFWQVPSGKLLKTLKMKGNIRSISFDGKGLLASGLDNSTVQVWQVNTGELLKTIQTPDSNGEVVFAKFGLLANLSVDGTVQLWNVKSGKLVKTLQAHNVNKLTFDGLGLLATIFSYQGDYKTVKLWQIPNGELVNTLRVQTRISSIAFDSAGLLAAGLDDGAVKLWYTKTGELKQTLLVNGQGAWANIHSDGTVLRADAGKILRKGKILAQIGYPVEMLETDKDGKHTGKTLTGQMSYQGVAWSYLSFPTSNTNSLAISLDKTSIDASAAQDNFFTVQLTNTSTEPIYHPKIIQTTSADSSLKIIPAEYLPTYPQTQAIYSSTNLIPAGQTIQLAARVIGNTPQPVSSGEYEIPITVEVSGGQTKTVTLKVNYQTPDVQVVSSDFSRDTNTLSIQLKNQGRLALPKADFYLKDAEGKLNLPRQSLEGIAAQTDAPPLAFTLPKDLPQDQLDKLQLEIRPMSPPLYTEWAIPITLTVIPMHMQLGLAALALALLGFTVFYFRRYRHPLVLALGEQPKALSTLTLEQLPEAQKRLQQTGRLKNVLENASVSVQTFQQAIDFSQLSAEQKAPIIAKRLNAQIVEQLSPELWMLKLPDGFILNLNRFLLYFPSVAAEDVFNTLYAIPQAEGRVRVIIGQDAAYQRKLLNTTQDRSNKYVAPQSKQITELLLSPHPEPVFAKILAEQLALQQLSPYQIGGGVNKEAIFFGRRELIAQIINRDPANYLIVGGRQMGKSSLLKALERRYAENPQVHCIYQTLSNETLIPRLAADLEMENIDSAQAFAQSLEARLKTDGRRYIFLIDEADLFIAHEQAQGYPILSVFRRLSEQGQCSFILAGFWQLYQHAVLDYQSPLRNFGEVLEVGALEQEACTQLATQPMQSLNLSYSHAELVKQIVSQCGQRANLIAYVCDQIIKQLAPSQRVIEAGDLHRVLEGRDLQKRLVGWSVGSGETEQAYDRLVVYSTVQQDSFTSSELMQQLDQQGVKFNSVELERALSRLELAFVLKKQQNYYSYCVPLFVEMLREDEVDDKREREIKQWH